MQGDFEAFYLRHFKAIYRVCYAFMKKYDNVVPIWGIQKMEELEQTARRMPSSKP